MDKIEGNRIIAEFMGVRVFEKRYPRNHGIGAPEHQGKDIILEKAKYHYSWDWLMPIVRKIADLLLNKDWDNLQHALARWKPICNELEKVNLENTWFCVVKFIEWYNKTK